MPTWTLGEIMSAVTTRAGRRSDLVASDVSFWINQAQVDFARDIEEFLSEKTAVFSVASGTSKLSLPADFSEVISLSEVSTTAGRNREIRQMSPEMADRVGYYPPGEPEGYFIFANEIQLWPSANSMEPDATASRQLLLRYRWSPSDITLSAAVPSVSTEHRFALVLKGEQYIHELVGNIEEAAGAEIRYTSFMMSLKDALVRKHAARGPQTVWLADQTPRRVDGRLEDQDEWLKR